MEILLGEYLLSSLRNKKISMPPVTQCQCKNSLHHKTPQDFFFSVGRVYCHSSHPSTILILRKTPLL